MTPRGIEQLEDAIECGSEEEVDSERDENFEDSDSDSDEDRPILPI
jgi:hypothetical protein